MKCPEGLHWIEDREFCSKCPFDYTWNAEWNECVKMADVAEPGKYHAASAALFGEVSKDSYLRSFVIGSSAAVFFPFFIGVAKFLPEKTFDYVNYSFKAPAYFGVTNVLSLYLQKKFGWTDDQRFKAMALISPAFVSTWITARKAYDFKTKERWIKQYLLLLAAHGITWLGTIRYLEGQV